MIKVIRTYYKDCTISRVITETGFNCFGLELPWNNNEQNYSCIPEGEYEYTKGKNSLGKPVLNILNVPNRSEIQVHIGNFVKQILGCLLVGTSLTYIDKDSTVDVSSSGVALNKLLAAIPDKGTILFTNSVSELYNIPQSKDL